jgi:hypothetical protein
MLDYQPGCTVPKVVVILDLLAGILIATNFLIPDNILRRIDRWLWEELPTPKQALEPLHRKSIRLSIPPAVLLFLGIIVWAIVQDLGKRTYSIQQVAVSVSIYLLGAFLGMATLVMFARGTRGVPVWARRFIHTRAGATVGEVYLVSFGMALLAFAVLFALIRFKMIIEPLIAFLATFAIGDLFLGLWMLLVPSIQGYFRLGVIQLTTN